MYYRRPLRAPMMLRGSNGSTLIIATLMIMVVSLLVMGVVSLSLSALRMSYRQKRMAVAFNLAESGTEAGVRYLRQLSTPPGGVTPFDPFGGPVALGEGTYQLTINPETSNPGAFLKTYYLISTGSANGITQRIELTVRQASFGRYAYFTDSEVSSFSDSAIWFKAGEVIDGPAHSNNTGGTNFQINYTGSNAPIFLDMLTAAGSSITYKPSKPKTEGAWQKIFRDGSRGFRLGVDRVELPDSTDAQRNAAWGNSAGFPTSNGVYIPNGGSAVQGGIYVVGDSTMRFSVDASGRQQLSITQSGKTTTITWDTGAMQTVVQSPSGGTTRYSGLPNGVIYSTGNITSISGTIANNQVTSDEITWRSSYTIATDVTGGKNITVTDNLTYATRPDKTKSVFDPVNLAAGTLGLVANNIIIPSNAPRNLEIDGVLLAGGRNTSNGSFYVSNYDSKTPVGTLKVIGGIIQKKRGPVGTFDSNSGQTNTGYIKQYCYDPRLADNPPPYFPTTGTFDRISWRRLPG